MRARRKDNNQAEIERDLLRMGFACIDLSSLGCGVPDLLVSDTTDMWLCEIKGPFGRLTPAQERYHQRWKGKRILTVKSLEEVIQKIKAPSRTG